MGVAHKLQGGLNVAFRHPRPTQIIVGLSVLQIIFQVVIGAVTGTRLDYDNLCQLNLDPESGRVCDFVYPTIGFGIFFSLLLTIGTVYAYRKGEPGPITSSGTTGLAVYAFIWYLVYSITIAIRGSQATDAGQPRTTERNAVVGLSWIVTVFFLAIAITSIFDKHINRIPVAGGKSFLLRKRVSGTPSTPGKSSEPETSASPLDNDPKQK